MENTTRNALEVNESALQEVLTPPDNGRGHPPTQQGTGVTEAVQAPPRSPQPGPGDPSGAGSSRRAESGRRGGEAPKKRGTQFFVTLCHWSMVVLLGISLLSGMRAGWEFVDSPLGGADGVWSAMLHAIAPKATLFGVNLLTLHVMSVWFLLLTAGIYTVYMFRTGHKRRLRTGGRDLKSILKALQTGGFWSNKGALWSANVLVYWVGFVSILVLIVTGLALYRVDWGWFAYLGGYGTVRFLHSLTAYLLVPYTILHGLLQWCFGTFWSIFKARFHRPLVIAGCIGAVVALPAVIGLYTRSEAPTTLMARYLAGTYRPRSLMAIQMTRSGA